MVVGEEPNNNTELNVRKGFVGETFSAFRDVVNLVRCSKMVQLLSRRLPWLYQCFYMSSFYRNDLIYQGSAESAHYNYAVKVVNKDLYLYMGVFL